VLCHLILPERGVGSGGAPTENRDDVSAKRRL
jgi:hypothetical protein